MKKALIIILALALAMALMAIVGCGGDDTTTAESEEGTTTVQEDGEEVSVEPDGDEEVPTDEELDSPLYPGAEYKEGTALIEDYGQGYADAEAVWTTDDDIDTVVAWYTGELDVEVVDASDEEKQEFFWSWIDNTETYSILVEVSQEQGSDEVEIYRFKQIILVKKSELGLE